MTSLNHLQYYRAIGGQGNPITLLWLWPTSLCAPLMQNFIISLPLDLFSCFCELKIKNHPAIVAQYE